MAQLLELTQVLPISGPVSRRFVTAESPRIVVEVATTSSVFNVLERNILRKREKTGFEKINGRHVT